jgi:hypothetical protein
MGPSGSLADDDLPRFTLKAWDQDLLTSSDYIGSVVKSAEVS